MYIYVWNSLAEEMLPYFNVSNAISLSKDLNQTQNLYALMQSLRQYLVAKLPFN